MTQEVQQNREMREGRWKGVADGQAWEKQRYESGHEACRFNGRGATAVDTDRRHRLRRANFQASLKQRPKTTKTGARGKAWRKERREVAGGESVSR